MLKWPSKVVELSACVIMIRSALKSNNYEVLLLKRAENISFGGYSSFPGGKIEP